MTEPVAAIGEYRVIRLIGSGGMGEVYLVQHPRLPRRDAVKLLNAAVSGDEKFRARFDQEASLLAGLRHPNVITIYDRGEYDGRLWLAMEYIDGSDAAQMLAQHGPLPLDLVIPVIEKAGAALDYAYAQYQITHRDVKPANILLAFEPAGQLATVKLADFGIAKVADQGTALTSVGMTMGTVSYVSPEAIEGRPLDSRADLYSLGCTAFELMTGQPPYAGDSMSTVLMAHLTAPIPSASAVNPALPAGVDEVFRRVLAKDPDQRYATCGEFAAALQAAAQPSAPAAGVGREPTPATVPVTRWAPQTAVLPQPIPAPAPQPVTPMPAAVPQRSPVLLILLGVLALVAVAVAATVAIMGQRGGGNSTAGPRGGSAVSTAPAATTSTSAPATGIGFDEMQAFVTGYYALLPGRPQDAWPKLDAGYQQRAGWSGYRDFWASIRSVSVTSVAPDGDQRVVAHLEYVSNDGRVSSENRWFRIIRRDGSLLIADSEINR
ncbi:MAG: serine/threonine-protein kinase [Mycolicibacterium insubricum]